ncbi:MAG: response regulator [Nitrospirota bacterium]|nr:response regulator [Nitrospirota bacterium]
MKTNNKKILVADDDVLLRKLFNDLLTFYGYDVDCVSNGKEAIALIETGSYDVLITDYLMPEMNGIELIKKARDIKKSLAIIGMSASEEERGFIAAGANFFIAKPFSPYALKNIIEGICLT